MGNAPSQHPLFKKRFTIKNIKKIVNKTTLLALQRNAASHQVLFKFSNAYPGELFCYKIVFDFLEEVYIVRILHYKAGNGVTKVIALTEGELGFSSAV